MSFTSFVDGTRWSDVYTAATCAFLAGTAMFTADFALTLRLQSEGYGGFAVAALIICATLPLVVLAPLTGRMADRFDSRTLMAASGLLQTAAIVAMAFTDNLYVLFALVILNASGTAITQPVVSALVPVMARSEDLPRAIAMVQTGTLVGLATGPAAAGFLIGANGIGAALGMAAACAVTRVLLCCDIRTRRGGVRRDLTAHAGAGRVAWRLGGDRLLTAMVFGLSAVIAAMCAVNVLSVFLVRESYGASESLYGLIKACWILGMVAGAWIAAAIVRRMERDVQLAWMLMACLAGVGLACFGQGLPLFSVLLLVPLNFIGGMFNAGENSALGIAIARRVPEAFRGRANAAVNGRVNAAQLIGFLLGGVVSTMMDVRLAFMAVGVVSIAIVIACLPVIRRAGREDDADRAGAVPTTGRDLVGAAVLTPTARWR
ncbi:MFS transporter [Glycomyces harbinensis]|uniref:Predicted arabinose efflux permease, MFS family n=1 Tax=Glycomyces harbinensis TaxID=58114 RepID=A0A1G6VR62_9ACTN|nr:MFS transporter [Glycomyces harbinensis]SDD55477.1 Predicted arabinose efflux permease, MFS family [Glycomyces harbinensis]